eukprot:symbB.v1.2.035606.t1/scaffold4832.1/size34166/3
MHCNGGASGGQRGVDRIVMVVTGSERGLRYEGHCFAAQDLQQREGISAAQELLFLRHPHRAAPVLVLCFAFHSAHHEDVNHSASPGNAERRLEVLGFALEELLFFTSKKMAAHVVYPSQHLFLHACMILSRYQLISREELNAVEEEAKWRDTSKDSPEFFFSV